MGSNKKKFFLKVQYSILYEYNAEIFGLLYFHRSISSGFRIPCSEAIFQKMVSGHHYSKSKSSRRSRA